MAEGGALDPLAPDLTEMDGAARVTAWLNDFSGDVGTPQLVRLRIASADPEELTLRAHRLLGLADRIYHRANISSAILARARADAVRIECAGPPDAPAPGLSLDLAYA
jgi:uroporphyrin-III C-methyltransferase/precorrin-2 dehydrogenase/sirohydrochlorin ferrochelatase